MVAGLALATGTLLACGEVTEAETALVRQEAVGEVQAAVTSVSPETLSADLLGDSARVFPEGQPVVNGDVDFNDLVDTATSMLVHKDASEVFVTFMSSTALNNNTLAFFTYQAGNTPTTAPALTTVFSGTSGLGRGTRVSLGFFNANTRIGFAILSSGNPTYYSVPGLNPDGVHFKAKYHKAEKRRVIGAEDIALASSDKDYNDVLFSVKVVPDEPPPPVTCTTSPAVCGDEEVPGDSCTHIKTVRPSAADDMYWVKTTSGKTRVYCDMQFNGGTELCREGVVGDYQGKTRDASRISYKMRSTLRPVEGYCEMWAIRQAFGEAPMDRLYATTGLSLDTCQALGFKGISQLGSCAYGASSGYTNCGFTADLYYRWGNKCAGCTLNDGTYSSYVRQGYMSSSHVLSDMSGNVRTRCKTK